MSRLPILLLLAMALPARALDIVLDGKPAAALVISAPARDAQSRDRKRAAAWDDAAAARVFVDWIRKISGATLPVGQRPPAIGAAIYIGQAALDAGLKLDDINSPTREGLRIFATEDRVLMAGQSGPATVKAVCRLLEQLGCRYFMDSPLGEVYPQSSTVRIDRLDIREKPAMISRAIWGSQWTANTLWKLWNGAGGDSMDVGHAWGRYLPQDLFAAHPQYFALRNGQRRKGDWYCTSNPTLREIFAQGVIRAIEARNAANISISPPDGVGYCQCERCAAQDDPASIEPSSGLVSMTDRYLDFFNDVARRVARKHPNALLDFYCYADYTQAPTRALKAEDNLVAWIAPIRYCRFHRIGQDNCPTRRQLEQMLNDWGKSSRRLAYRTYNYNLAECLVPFSMLSVWKHDVPYLNSHRCIAINLETLPSWNIYGPHIYLSIRLAYSPSADADAIIDDYFSRFFGPAAEPMKQYWLDIDNAFAHLDTHSGSFYALHRAYTPALLKKCSQSLEKAARAAGDHPLHRPRVAMNAQGFRNAAQYIDLRNALNSGRIDDALKTYRELLARAQVQVQSGYANHYAVEYLKRFLGAPVEAAAAAVHGNRIVAVLPDRMRMACDKEDRGIAQNWADVKFDDSKWREVATYTDTLDAQGLPDEKTILWYRTSIDVPRVDGKCSLLFIEVDGAATVFVNGQQVGTCDKERSTFAVDISSAVRPGKNTVAVRVDHSRITELMLGGLIRPVYLLASPAPTP